jgi:hypothetical protein
MQCTSHHSPQILALHVVAQRRLQLDQFTRLGVNRDETTSGNANKYFQDQHVLTRSLVDPRTGETRSWPDFLGHRIGKSIVRTSVSVQARSSHTWVRDQKKRFPFRPAYIPVPTQTCGYHYHFFAFQNSRFKEKFQKQVVQSEVWRYGRPRRFPRHCLTVAATCQSDDALLKYLDQHASSHERITRQ